MTDASRLSCERVTKRYGALAAVDDLSFSVGPGEVLGIGGPNGAGKTTLFDIVSGLTSASDGAIRFNGVDVTRLSPDRLCRLGMARTFQLNAGFDSLTARENVQLAGYFGQSGSILSTMMSGARVREACDEALAFVGLQDKAGEEVRNLPVFDRKLLMLAGAVVTDPSLLLMDEPVGGLTPGETDHFIGLVDQLRARGMTIILIEHVMRFLVRLSDRVMIMNHGQKIYEGPPDQLAHDEQVLEVYLGAGAAERLQHMMQGGAA